MACSTLNLAEPVLSTVEGRLSGSQATRLQPFLDKNSEYQNIGDTKSVSPVFRHPAKTRPRAVKRVEP